MKKGTALKRLETVKLSAFGGQGKSTLLNICQKALEEAGYTVVRALAEFPEGHTLLCMKEWKRFP